MLHLENFFEKSFALLLTTPTAFVGRIFLLQFIPKPVILESSGMVNEFQGCIARIPNLAKARFAGFVCCIHLQLSEKIIA